MNSPLLIAPPAISAFSNITKIDIYKSHRQKFHDFLNEHMLKQKIRAAKLYFPSDVAITDMGKELLRKMLHKDPKERLDLLNFLEMDYYNIEDDKFEELVQHSQAEKAEELAEKARL